MLSILGICIFFPENIKSLKTSPVYYYCFVKQRPSELHDLALCDGSCQQPQPGLQGHEERFPKGAEIHLALSFNDGFCEPHKVVF